MAPEHLALERIEVGDLQTNAYLLYSRKTLDCLIIDPGAEPKTIARHIKKLHLTPRGIILTHGHFDHFGAIDDLKALFHIPLWMHDREQAMLDSPLHRQMAETYGFPMPPPADHLLKDDDRLEISDIALFVLHTPGHSPGSMSLSVNGWLFSGDTLFQGDIGRTDLPGGDFASIKRSIERLMAFPDATEVFPGHGEPTTIGDERRFNSCL